MYKLASDKQLVHLYETMVFTFFLFYEIAHLKQKNYTKVKIYIAKNINFYLQRYTIYVQMDVSRKISSYECISDVEDFFGEECGSIANPDSENPSRASDLLSAVQNGDLERAKVLVLMERASVDNSSHPCVQNPLMGAVVYEQINVLRFLLSHNADVNLRSSCCNRSVQISTPLCVAAEQGFFEICSLLLDHKANVDIKTVTGLTPLLIAIEQDNTALVSLLLHKRPHLKELHSENQINPLVFSAEIGKQNMIELLLEVDFPINVHGTKFEKSLLYYAAMYGNIFFASHLIRLGFDIHESGNDSLVHVDDEEGVGWKRLRYTPLYKAAEGGHTETVIFLLEAGADINRGGKLRYDTPLYIASANGHLKVVQVLIKNQAKYDSLEGVTHFFSPFYAAVVNGHLDVAQWLLCIHKYDGRNLIYKDAFGNQRTAISFAAEYGLVDMVELLLDLYFEEPKEGDEHSPLHYAVKNCREDVVKILLADERIRVNICSRSNKKTPLFHANVQIAEILLNANANPNTVDVSGDSPLSLAAKQSNVDLVRLLLAHGARVCNIFSLVECELTRSHLWSASEVQKLHLRNEGFNYLEEHMYAHVCMRSREVRNEESLASEHRFKRFTETLLNGKPYSEYRLDQWLPYTKWEIQAALLTQALEIFQNRFKVSYLFLRQDKPDFVVDLSTLPTWDYVLWKRCILHDGVPIVTTRILSFLTFMDPLKYASIQEILTYYKALKREHPVMFLRLKNSRISNSNTKNNQSSRRLSKKALKYEEAMVDLKIKQNTAVATARLAYTANAYALTASEAADAASDYAASCATELASEKALAAESAKQRFRDKRPKN